MYCKLRQRNFFKFFYKRINSSKVYCKFDIRSVITCARLVLIVAKCIVNFIPNFVEEIGEEVLIVAKCIVNVLNHYYCEECYNVLIVAFCNVNIIICYYFLF